MLAGVNDSSVGVAHVERGALVKVCRHARHTFDHFLIESSALPLHVRSPQYNSLLKAVITAFQRA